VYSDCYHRDADGTLYKASKARKNKSAGPGKDGIVKDECSDDKKAAGISRATLRSKPFATKHER